MPSLKKISDEADMIVCGFAYKKTDEGISVFDLNNGIGAAVLQITESLLKQVWMILNFQLQKKNYLANAKYMEI